MVGAEADSAAGIRAAAGLAASAAEIRAAAERRAIGDETMEQRLKELVTKLTDALGDRLVSVILYGSAAGGEHHGKFSDLNVLCVLSRVTPGELGACDPVLRWWRETGNPAPLLMTEEEVRTSTDCFAIEFHDMMERRRVLHGADVVAGLEVSQIYYRAQVEHELRTKLFRLRDKAAGSLKDSKTLTKLMLDSVSTFAVLLRHAMLLSGVEVSGRKRDIVAALPKIGVKPGAFETLLDVREGKAKPETVQATELFTEYLGEIETAVRHVDGLSS